MINDPERKNPRKDASSECNIPPPRRRMKILNKFNETHNEWEGILYLISASVCYSEMFFKITFPHPSEAGCARWKFSSQFFICCESFPWLGFFLLFVLRSWQHFVRVYIEAEIPRFVHAASTLKIRRKFVLARSLRKCRFLAELRKRPAERVAESLINNKVQFEWKISPNFSTQAHTIVSRMRRRMKKWKTHFWVECMHDNRSGVKRNVKSRKLLVAADVLS